MDCVCASALKRFVRDLPPFVANPLFFSSLSLASFYAPLFLFSLSLLSLALSLSRSLHGTNRSVSCRRRCRQLSTSRSLRRIFEKVRPPPQPKANGPLPMARRFRTPTPLKW
jgi:hypothetical protein